LVYSRPSNRERFGENQTTMKNNILLAVPVSVIAVAALVLSFRSLMTVESLIGYAGVFGLLCIASLEYRISWKRLFGRG
jgi:succinate-acetate transporter protein